MSMSNRSVTAASLVVPSRMAQQLLDLYRYRDPRRPARLIPGYDRPHALRTAKLCAAVALQLGYTRDRVEAFQVACLLHDLGRAGLDRRLFGAIWTWARQQGIPTRPAEWRAAHPETPYGRETEAFLERYCAALAAQGIRMDAWACEQVEMRLGYARRLARQIRRLAPAIATLGVQWQPWMTHIMLAYYYPERLVDAPGWVRQLGEILVACEQFEAYSNRRRGRDYYARSGESLGEAFAYLDTLQQRGVVSEPIVTAVRELVAEGAFDAVLRAARGHAVTAQERASIGLNRESTSRPMQATNDVAACAPLRAERSRRMTKRSRPCR